MSNINLTEFLSRLRKDVDQFESFCKADQAKFPDHWPEEMSEGDWYDQFLGFMSSHQESG